MILRKLRDETDLYFLYETMKLRDYSFFSNDIYRGNFGYFCSGFDRLLSDYFHDFYLIADGEKRLGYVATHDFKSMDSHCFIELNANVNENDYKTILTIFLKKLLKEYGLNKVFTLIIDESKLAVCSSLGFTEEACLKNYIYEGGKLNDLRIYSYKVEEVKFR